MDNELGVAFEFVQLPNGLVMGKYPVTQAQWELVMGSNPSEFKGPNKPVERVSWNDTQDFCQKLSQITGDFFVLPTSEEWEYACRAGSTTRFSFGDDENQLEDYGWYWLNSNSTTHPVGEKKPNPWGLYDMHGNVWEWTATGKENGESVLGGEWFEKLPAQFFRLMHGGSYIGHGCGSDRKISGPEEAQVSNLGFRLVRGGSWFDTSACSRPSSRLRFTPGYRDDIVGFRVIRGGGWESLSANCPSAVRGHSATDCGRHRDDLGFRLVRGGCLSTSAEYCSAVECGWYTPGFTNYGAGFRIVKL